MKMRSMLFYLVGLLFFSPVYVLPMHKQDDSQWLCRVLFHVFSVIATCYMFLGCRYSSLCYWPVAEIRLTDQRLVWRGGRTICVLRRYDASVITLNHSCEFWIIKTVHLSVNICLFRCLHPDRCWSTDDGSRFSGMLWCHPGVPLHAGTGLYLFLVLFVYFLALLKFINLTYSMASYLKPLIFVW